jgi:hypothetical protein
VLLLLLLLLRGRHVLLLTVPSLLTVPAITIIERAFKLEIVSVLGQLQLCYVGLLPAKLTTTSIPR